MYAIHVTQGMAPQNPLREEVTNEVVHQKPPKSITSKPHPCDRCSKTFSSVHQLSQHTRVHTGEKPYKCNYCERRFKQQSHVKQHSRLHTGERPYKCIECGRTFVQLSNLQQHMGNHAKDPHKTQQFQSQNCQICGKGFATEASLNLHMEKKHRDILSPADESSNVSMLVVRQPKPKAYVCVLCSKSYTTESALAIHAVKHKATSSPESKSSSESPSSSSPRGFGCRICPETFVTNEGLHEHMKIAHLQPDFLRQTQITYSSIPYCPPPHPSPGGPPVPSVPWFDPYQHYLPPPPNFHKSGNPRKDNGKNDI